MKKRGLNKHQRELRLVRLAIQSSTKDLILKQHTGFYKQELGIMSKIRVDLDSPFNLKTTSPVKSGT